MQESIITEAKQKQMVAITETLVGNHRRFLRFLSHRVSNMTDAEEILQAAFVKSVEKSDSVRNSENVVAWFYQLLRNAIIDHYRSRDAECRTMNELAGRELEVEREDPDLEHEICQCVHDLLRTLNQDYSGLLRRIDLEGAAISEVAKDTGLSTNNTRVKLHRARKSLRKRLELSCGSCAKHGCLDCSC
jgi:RNA polymerase sigma-70 factor (ECF subfamily)